MAISVSAALKAAWKKKYGQAIYVRVQYRRRYYDIGSPVGMTWEADWLTLPDAPADIGQIPQALDTPWMNLFRTSEVSIQVDNTYNQWVETADLPSIFAADGTVEAGYKAYLTKMRIQQGYKLASGTVEWVTRFTGVLKNIRLAGRSATAELTIASMAHLLETADAEEVSDTFTQEATVPSEQGSPAVETDTFLTQSIGVDHISLLEATNPAESPEVYSEVTPGTWSLSGTGKLAAASITFDETPNEGTNVRATGRKWKANEAIEDLVTLLIEEAGFAPSEYSVASVVIPGGLSGSQTVSSQADWEGGSVLTNCDSTTDTGSLKVRWQCFDDFSDGDFTTDPVWSFEWPGAASGPVVTGGKLRMNDYDSGKVVGLRTPFSKTYGTWSWDWSYVDSSHPGAFYLFTEAGQYTSPVTGYAVIHHITSGTIRLVKVTNGSVTVLVNGGAFSLVGTKRINVTRDADGNFELFVDGSSLGTATDNTHNTANYMCIGEASSGKHYDIDNIYWSEELLSEAPSSSTTTWESREYDLLSIPTAFGILEADYNLNGGTVTLYTASGASSGALDAYVPLGVGNQIASNPHRYFKMKAVLTAANLVSPSVQSLVANFTLSGINVSVANHEGKTCLEALERYAAIADYEFGASSTGAIFFRSKTPTGTYEVELTQENAIIDVLEYDPGYSRIYNVGKVRSGQDGEFYSEYSGADAGEAAPTSETLYRRRAKSEDYSDILLANDVNLAESRARAVYENNYLPKRRLKLKVWDIPWLEIGDVVRISFYDHPLLRAFIAGDPLQKWGTRYHTSGIAQNVLARDEDMKVIEWCPDITDPGNCILTVEEIL